MRWLAVALALSAAACAEPANENVSLEGPASTTTQPPATTESAQPVEVGRWSGTSDTDTENITVDASWELHWRLTGDGFAAVKWTEPGNQLPEDLLSLNAAEGQSLIREGGTFYLTISIYGGGSYEIWAVDVPN